MEGASSRKRKIDHEDVSEPATKTQKLSVVDDENLFDWTKMPPEILLNVFDFLKPEDDCMKKLSSVCKFFYDFCSPRLRVLHLDFDKIYGIERSPVIQRAYTEIRMIGGEIDCSCDEIGSVLESSKYSARKLVITARGRSRKRSKIMIRTLMFILRSLPNLEEVVIEKMSGLVPVFSRNAIKAAEHPSLPHLKRLTLVDVTAPICSAFMNAANIEELKVKLRLTNNTERGIYASIVHKQKNLKVLDSDVGKYSWLLGNHFTVSGQTFGSLLEDHPMLEHIKVSPDYWNHNFAFTSGASLLTGPPMTSLKTIHLVHCNIHNLEIEKMLEKFPSLESFKTLNFDWGITNA